MKNYHFTFGISDQTGWGIYGYNLVVEAWLQKLFFPVPQGSIDFLIRLDPVTSRIFGELEDVWRTSPAIADGDAILVSTGNAGARRFATGKKVKQAGLIFFERNPLADEQLRALREFDLVVAGSTWNAETLKEHGVERAKLIVQGVNADLFRPLPKRAMKDRFVVFSGGKLEYRKGQDLVVAAFSKFAQKRDDALLVAAWNSPWSTQIAASVNQSNAARPIAGGENFSASVAAWIADNGIAARQFMDLGSVPNRFMPEVFREADVALFPNRCEGGTNLVAMEALASGLTCIISKNTGHLDIIRPGNCLPLATQRPVKSGADEPRRDWGESDVDEIVSLLEKAYATPRLVQPDAARASVAGFTWARAIKSLHDCVQEAP